MNVDHRAESAPGSRRTGRRTARTAVLAAATAVALVGLAACGGAGGETGGTVELTYGVWEESQVPAMEDIAERFEAANPGITVQIQLTPWDQYWTKLQTAATGGSAPDVFWMTNAYFPSYADGGVLQPLDELVDDGDIDMADYNDAMAEAYTWDGTVYGVPKDIDSIGLWYNKTMFAEAGIPFPDETWTWERVHEVARQLTDPAAGVYGIAAHNTDQLSYYTTIPQAGGSVLAKDKAESGYDSPEAIEAIQYWVDFIDEGSSPTLQQMTDTDPNSMFTSGKVAMIYEGSWAAIQFDAVPYARENVDVAPLPAGRVPGGVVNGLANVMFAQTEYPEEARRFLAFLGSREAAEIQAATGTVIPAFKGTAEQWVQSLPHFHLESFLGGLEVGSPMPASLKTAEWRSYATEQFAKAWTGEEPVEVVARRVADFMDEVLADEQDG
jgi:multiple sugar transport system substrate-binding protein